MLRLLQTRKVQEKKKITVRMMMVELVSCLASLLKKKKGTKVRVCDVSLFDE